MRDGRGSVEASLGEKRKLADELVARWPSLPFMALGLWIAWYALTYSGSLWLSDSEVNGRYLSELFVDSGAAHAATLLALAVLAARGRAGFAAGKRFALAGGAVAGLGCLAVVAVGPYWLGSVLSYEVTHVPFVLGGLLSGVGTACVGLRCGVIYSEVPPRRALVYTALSQLVAAFVYLLVRACPTWAPIEHGPSLANVLAFCLLPVAAAALACVEPGPRSGLFDAEVAQGGPVTRRLPGAFWRLVAFLLIMTLGMSVMRSAVVTTHALASSLDGSDLVMLLRVVLGLGLVVCAVRTAASPGSLGRACSLLAIVAATATACAAAFGGLENELSVLIYAFVAAFETLTWCLLAFVAVQKRVDAVLVFGVGRGVYMLGTTLGWAVGSLALPLASSGGARTAVFLAAAGITLLVGLVLFSERDCERLFSPVSEGELALGDLFELEERERRLAGAARGGRGEKHGRFSRAVEEIAAAHALSGRETETLRCLAMGYGSDRVAETMGVKVNTARAHTHNVYVKLDVHSREELMRLVDEAVARQ